MITFEINGIEYSNIVESTFLESMIEFTNEATFKIALDGTESAPFIVDDEAVVYLDDVKVMTGYIYDVNLSYEKDSHNLVYIVRDKTADFSDSDINKISDLAGSLSLTNIIKKIIEDLGTDIQVVNEFDDLKNFTIDNDDIRPTFGEGAFEYIEGLARKRQVLLSTNAEGEIIIFRNSGEVMSGKIQNSVTNTAENNILSCDFSFRKSDLFNKYVVESQLSSASSKSLLGSGVDNKEITHQTGEFINENSRVGRQRCLLAEESSTSEVCKERAKWQNDFSNVESSSYSVQLQGHSLDGEIYKSNMLVQVIDDFARIDDKMLIKSVSTTYSDQTGSLTQLDLVDKDSFLILSQAQEEETQTEATKNIFEGL